MQKQFLILIVFLQFILSPNLFSQDADKTGWDLNQCINYALDHNIQIQKTKLDVASSNVNLQQAKSNRLPNLSASVSESFSNAKDLTTSSWDLNSGTSFNLGSSVTLYNGGALSMNIKQQSLNVDLANLGIEEARNSIILSITQSYLNVLYAKESLDYTKEVVVASEKQAERARELLNAGSFARKDVAQIESQLANDKYSLVLAQNTLTSRITELKQLLEIPVTDPFNVSFPDLSLDQSFEIIPAKIDVFNSALSIMPEIKSSETSIRISETEMKIAKAGYLPTLSMNANYSTDFSGNSSGSFSNQLNNNQSQKLGLTLSIPIFNRNATRASVQQSKISLERVQLAKQETEKNLLQQVEVVYQNTEAGLTQYTSAQEQFTYANENYKLSEEQYNLGMLTTVELLQSKNSLLNAKMELIQSKFSAIFNRKILDFYMGNSITL
ncbi:MAG TPA: TolC family protein [Tenuifilaceae bacterium]|nr:TolC family protein [Tenuifilaceae bacterium]